MKLQTLRPVLYTNQLEETIQFYHEHLDFELVEYNESWGWASLCKDDVAIMLAKPNDHMPIEQPMFTGSFYFNVTDVEAWWKRLKEAVNICYPIETFEWGLREFAIYDNNGYVLQLGQEWATQ